MPVPTVSTPILWTCVMKFTYYFVGKLLPDPSAPSCSRQEGAFPQGGCAWPRSILHQDGVLPVLPSSTPPPWLIRGIQKPPCWGRAPGSRWHKSQVDSRLLQANRQGCLQVNNSNWKRSSSNAHVFLYGCDTHHQDFVHSHSRCQQRMRSLEHLWTGPLLLPSDEKGHFNNQLWITRRQLLKIPSKMEVAPPP